MCVWVGGWGGIVQDEAANEPCLCVLLLHCQLHRLYPATCNVPPLLSVGAWAACLPARPPTGQEAVDRAGAGEPVPPVDAGVEGGGSSIEEQEANVGA